MLTHGQERLFCKVTSVFEETKGVIRICKSKDKKKGIDFTFVSSIYLLDFRTVMINCRQSEIDGLRPILLLPIILSLKNCYMYFLTFLGI